jgi:hypothetical protein
MILVLIVGPFIQFELFFFCTWGEVGVQLHLHVDTQFSQHGFGDMCCELLQQYLLVSVIKAAAL